MSDAKRGRPTKLNPQVQRDIVDAIGTGMPYELAARYGGVSYHSFNNWMKRGRAEADRLEKPRTRPKQSETPFLDFFEAVKDAEARGAMTNLLLIRQHAQSEWRAAAWLLERRHPESFGKRDALAMQQTGEQRVIIEYQGETGAPIDPPAWAAQYQSYAPTELLLHGGDDADEEEDGA